MGISTVPASVHQRTWATLYGAGFAHTNTGDPPGPIPAAVTRAPTSRGLREDKAVVGIGGGRVAHAGGERRRADCMGLYWDAIAIVIECFFSFSQVRTGGEEAFMWNTGEPSGIHPVGGHSRPQ